MQCAVCFLVVFDCGAMKRVGYILALGLCASPVSAAPQLAARAIDIHQTSVSGVSSGGAMAVQMHVAHSSIMRGVGIIAGVVYDCANSNLLLVSERVAQGLICLDGSVDYAPASIARTNAAEANGFIDALANLPRQKVWLFSGYNDGKVRRGAMDAVARYYRSYVDPGNVFYKTNNRAPHALVTDGSGGPCLDFKAPYINNCNYDAAGHLLEHIYGRLNGPGNSLSSSPRAFDQIEFQDQAAAGQIGLADTGYVYVPAACETETCRVHVVFHGCQQYAENPEVGNAVYKHGGYNRWADTNRVIVLYPQTVAIPLLNKDGCWDWWGLNDFLPRNCQFAQKSGYQISAIKKMLDRLAGGPPHAGGSPDTFGTPQHFEAADTTSTSVALIWQRNRAAAGFNIYRSSGSTGPYTKINSTPVQGASFADRGLSPNTDYHYKIRAIDGSDQESAEAGPVHVTTASVPPACDPYAGANATHVAMGRAIPYMVFSAVAIGSLDYMGPNDMNHSSHLIKEDGPWPWASSYYRVRYCP